MKTVVIESFGDPSGLVLVDRPAPVPAVGEVLVAVEAVGVGGVDTLIRLADYGFAVGHVPGAEIAGTVIGTGLGARIAQSLNPDRDTANSSHARETGKPWAFSAAISR